MILMPFLRFAFLFIDSTTVLQGEVVVLVRSMMLRGFDRDLVDQVQVNSMNVSAYHAVTPSLYLSKTNFPPPSVLLPLPLPLSIPFF